MKPTIKSIKGIKPMHQLQYNRVVIQSGQTIVLDQLVLSKSLKYSCCKAFLNKSASQVESVTFVEKQNKKNNDFFV